MRPATATRVDESAPLRRLRPNARLQRKAKARRLALDSLEPRTLLAVVPTAVYNPQIPLSTNGLDLTRDVSNQVGADESSPAIAINRQNPDQLASVWVTHDPDFGITIYRVFGATSNNGGNTWTTFNASPIVEIDPATIASGNPLPFSHVTDATVAFDRNNRFYVLTIQHSPQFLTGMLVLDEFNFSGGSPVLTDHSVLHVWNQSDQNFSPRGIHNAVLAIDDNVPTYSDVDSTGAAFVQNNPGSGNLYVAYATDVPPPNPNPFPFWSRQTIEMQVSTNGGATFGTPLLLSLGHGQFGTNQVPVRPQIAISQAAPRRGVPGGQVTVIFDDINIGRGITPQQDVIWSSTFNPQSGLVTSSNNFVAATTVLGALESPFPNLNSPAAPARGIGPNAVIAADNTLGAFSPNQGRIYVAYVDRYDSRRGDPGNNATNPLDNTDIQMVFSDDGGINWSGPNQINDDAGYQDGFSHALVSLPFVTGRPQFMPQIAVDQTNGMLVIQYVDARWDAARARTGISITASIDGGSSFNPSTFVNAPQYAFDGATFQNVIMGPIPDNVSTGNPLQNATTGIGDFQGLAVHAGKSYTAWASNVNGGDQLTTRDNQQDIRVASMLFASGPRVVASTMGQVGSQQVTGLDGSVVLVNSGSDYLTGASFNGFLVTFDRPVDPATFTPDDVRIYFRNPSTPGTAPGTLLPLPDFIIPLDSSNGTSAAVRAFELQFGPRQFAVLYSGAFSDVGTYSYTVGPDIRDRFRFPIATSIYSAEQIAANLPTLPPAGTGGSGVPANDRASSTINIVGVPANELIIDLDVKLSLEHPRVRDLRIRLVPPPALGLPAISLTQNNPTFPTASPANFTDTTFDDDARTAITGAAPPFSGNFRPFTSLTSLNGRSPNGTWTLEIDDTVTGMGGGRLISWSLVVRTRSNTSAAAQLGNFMDQDADAAQAENAFEYLIRGTSPGDIYMAPRPATTAPALFGPDGPSANDVFFPGPFDSTTLPLIVPGPHLVDTFVLHDHDNDPGTPAEPTRSIDDLVTDETVSAVYVVFDRAIDISSFTNDKVLRVSGPQGLINGPFVVTPAPNADPTVSDPIPGTTRTFEIQLPTNVANSGSYTVTLDSSIRSFQTQQALDQDRDAGLDQLRGTPTNGTITQNFTRAGSVPLTAGNPSGVTTVSTLTITDSFNIQDLNIVFSISIARAADLVAKLVSPGGTEVLLFSRVGNTFPFANFTNTTLDDSALTPIQNGGPPFSNRYNPHQPLSAFIGTLSSGTWQLQVTNFGTNSGSIGTWTLQLQKAVSTTGLGEPVADRPSGSFRIFTLDPTDPLTSSTWTAVGPAGAGAREPAGNAEVAGRITAIAVDPSDPSGNTVYVGTPSGGVWKSTNFLTTAATGPIWLPLTDNAPLFGVGISSITVFSRNNDPNQSIIFAGTGDASALGDPSRPASLTSRGIGFLRSLDGGATWALLDSTNNGVPLANRDHFFASSPGQGGATVFKIVVDPRAAPGPAGDVIVYAAVADVAANGTDVQGTGTRGGIWRSLDTGRTWTQLRAGQATDVVLDPNSASATSGNLQFVYSAFRGEGVFFSPNRGQVWNIMAGTTGNPLIQDVDAPQPQPIPVTPDDTPNNKLGRIVLAKPALTGIPATDLVYQGWLYAAVVNRIGDQVQTPQGSNFIGLYLTKDFGQNWTRIDLPNDTTEGSRLPTNDNRLPDYTIAGSGTIVGAPFTLGNYNLSVSVDPNDPNVVYLGGSRQFQAHGLIRVDASELHDPHAFYLDNRNPAGTGTLRTQATGPVTETQPDRGIPFILPGFEPAATPIINLIRDPQAPFVAGATILVTNTATFQNDGGAARWTPFDYAVKPDIYANPLFDPWGRPTLGINQILTVRDPLTGRARLLFGTEQGIYTAVDKGDGTLIGSVGGFDTLDRPDGDVTVVQGSRNGNLQIAQFYAGAAQPSQLAADLAALAGFFYGSSESTGTIASDPNILNPNSPSYGNLSWLGGFTPLTDRGPSRGGIATEQNIPPSPTAIGGTLYFWRSSEALVGFDGRPSTDTFQVDATGRVFGLYQTSSGGNVPDNQWPFREGFQFAVNPLNGGEIIIGSEAGRVFATDTRGLIWSEIRTPNAQDGSPVTALVFGAPEPVPVGSVPDTNNYLLFGTTNGNIFVTYTGGGGVGNNWFLSQNLDGSPIQSIITNPAAGSREAYAVTANGVFHIRDTDPNSGEVWENITGNLLSIVHDPFLPGEGTEVRLRNLTSIVADWSYVIPDSFLVPFGPTHPVLYVAGRAGVYRSLDSGASWTVFPDTSEIDRAEAVGGHLPNVLVTDLDFSLGNVNPDNGRPQYDTGENLLIATTYGRGQFAIRLKPIVFPNSLTLSPLTPPPSGSDSGASNTDRYTNVATPFVDGLSEQTAFGNVVTINILDQTTGSPTFGQVIGTGTTDEFGRFSIQITTGDPMNPIVPLFQADGVKTIGVQAINQSGTLGNIALLTITLDRTPPAKPAVPMLTLPSDTGTNPFGDQITSQSNNLVFQVFVTAGEPSTTFIQLFRGATLVGQRSGTGTITDMNDLEDGVYTYRTRQVDLAGNESEFSDNYNVRIDTDAPEPPAAPALDTTLPPPNGSDTGTAGDNITSVTRPFLRGNAEENPWENPNQPGVIQPNTIQIIDAAGNILGSGLISDNGSYSVQPDVGLSDGIHNLRVRVLDVAGNVGAASAPLQIRILSQQPGVPTIRLVEADDSGVPGDHITNVLRPRLTGMGQAGLRVEIILELGTIPGVNIGEAVPGDEPVFVQSDGTYLFRFAEDLDPGTYRFRARVIDIAGNFNDSVSLNPVLQIIDSGAQLPTPILIIDPRDDTGQIDNPASGPVVTSVRRARFIAIAEPDFRIDLVNVANGQLLDSRIAGADGRALLRLPGNLVNGVIRLQARARDVAGNQGPPSNILTLRVVTTFDDYDSDGRADLANYNPTTGQFLVNRSTLGNIIPTPTIPPNLQRTDIPISGDFDGDGQTDIGVFRPTTAQWIIRRSTTGVTTSFAFGAPTPPTQANPVDLPVPADFDGDGRSDLAVFRAAEGRWLVLLSGGGILNRVLGGQPGDVPVPGDYDGDFKDDIAIFRPATATWIVRPSTGGVDQTTVFGSPNVDVPIRGDFDGDYRLDLAVWRSTTGQWQFRSSATGQVEPLVTFGLTTDIPAPADYDGDGRTDFAFLRQASTQYQIRQSSNGQTRVQNHGVTIDIPVPSPLKFRVRPPSGPVGNPSFGGDGNFSRSSSSTGTGTGTGSIGGGFLRNDGTGFGFTSAGNSANNSSGGAGTGTGSGGGFTSNSVPSGPASSPGRRATAAQLRAERLAIQNLQRAIRTARLQEDRLERRLSASGANTAAIDQALEAVHVRIETLRTRLRTLQSRRHV